MTLFEYVFLIIDVASCCYFMSLYFILVVLSLGVLPHVLLCVCVFVLTKQEGLQSMSICVTFKAQLDMIPLQCYVVPLNFT